MFLIDQYHSIWVISDKPLGERGLKGRGMTNDACFCINEAAVKYERQYRSEERHGLKRSEGDRIASSFNGASPVREYSVSFGYFQAKDRTYLYTYA